ncbi:outer membrane protein transport protein [Phyllobacterium sp. YR531]|uniref:OmpP1/FadL family transporter n=1 Tax=Phyllobacterium sp. YR531 TaxID=1144343 RepID=UPI00026F7DF7|nr:outer membrane protein transport protein [Phyllobacterium sp. YR531]EJN06328.1 long-chain fatty acid transport protein [Phyllobacterium sp. YR531]
MNHKALIVAVALAGCASNAYAGGFSWGVADTDILYEEGDINMRSGVTFVRPNQKYSKNGNTDLVGTSQYETYVIPSFAIKLRLTEGLSCAGTYTKPWGAEKKYDAPTVRGDLSERFHVDEFGATCAVKLSVGKGNVYFLGGMFIEQFDYEREIFGGANLTLEGQDTGYRVGVAYDIPEIAFRTQLKYRSGTSYGADGTLSLPGGLVGAPVPFVDFAAKGEGSLPQSVQFDIQSGIAPGWLVFGTVQWTDWSVLKTLRVTSDIDKTADQYNWRDGWTVTAGVAHEFSKDIAANISLTWDQGVSTGWDLTGETWMLAVGGLAKDKFGGELRGGVGAVYMPGLKETKYGPANAEVDDGWAFVANVGYAIKW